MSNDDFDFTQPQSQPAGSVPPTTKPAPSQGVAAAAAATSAPFKPANSKFYDAKVAEQFFRELGKPEQFAAGSTLFSEGDKSGKQGLFGKRVIHRMYYLAEGEVALTANGKLLDAVKSGEVIGEMAVISEMPGTEAATARSATATAKTAVRGFSLDGTEAQAGLARMPEFALMLMSVMFDRLRFVAARMAMRKLAKPAAASAVMATPMATSMATFNADLLAALEARLERATVLRYEPGSVIMREGDAGTTMYVILRGQVEVSIKGSMVESASTGATIGEMALVDQSARAATATAKTECKLLAVNRKALIEIVKAEPAIGMAMMRSMAARLRNMNILLNA
ncbi:MAG: cyclic nucleotide-binding domain-containing protein [Aeromicrobium sp.]|nr:cyclic nucleotide-binding domain-containing protein [Burkholderiales bacterium]